MKLAPTQDQLQPLPPNVQPAVSQSVQRTASPADLQTIQQVQAAEESSGSSQYSVSPSIPLAPYSSSDSLALWIALVVALLVAAAIAWLWRSF